jgi:hypothetical protein
MILNNKNIEKKSSSDSIQSTEEVSSRVAYQAPHPQYEVDVLSQFRANMAQLEDLQARFKFVMHEVSTLMAKK